MNLVEFAPNSCLYPKTLHYKRVFGVSMCLSKGTEESKQMITFEALVEIIRRQETSSDFKMSYQKSDVRINHTNQTSNVLELALKCTQAFYPMELEVSSAGAPAALLNQQEIAQRWQHIRQELDQYYTDASGQWYLNQTEKMLTHGFLESFLGQDLFLSLFLGLSYPIINRRKAPALALAIYPGRPPVNYALTQEVASEYTQHNTVVIERRGVPDDPRNGYELLTGYEQTDKAAGPSDLKGELWLTYEIEKETHLLQSISAKVSLELAADEHRELALTAYHLRERDKELITETEAAESKPKGLNSLLKYLFS